MPRRRRPVLRITLTWLPLMLIALVACAGDDDGAREPDVEITVQMAEYDFVSDVVPEFRAGQTVRFVVENVGVIPHEVQVLDTEATVLAQTGSVAAGDRTELVVTFDDAGVYQMICDIDDHLSRGQRALFEVRRADGTSVLDD